MRLRRRRALALALAGFGASAAIAIVTSACSYVFESALPVPLAGPILPEDPSDGSDSIPLVEAAAPAESPPPPLAFCASQVSPFLYCEDFDGAQTTLAQIGNARSSGGGLIEIVNVVSLSPLRSLLTSAPGGPSGDSFASLTRALNQDPDGVTLSFGLLVSRWQASAASVAQIEIASGSGSPCFVRLGADTTTWSVTQTCSATEASASDVVTVSTSRIDAQRWHRFSLSLRSKVVRLEIDGASAVSVPAMAAIDRGLVSIGIGVDHVVAGNATVFQDDVLVTTP